MNHLGTMLTSLLFIFLIKITVIINDTAADNNDT